MPHPPQALDRNALILVLAPSDEDAILCREVLGDSGFRCVICRNLDDLSGEFEAGAGAILLTEGALSSGDPDRLLDTLQQQPEWSDIPVLLLVGGGADAPAAAWLMEALGNVTVLDRPVRIITLVSALRSAIKARNRQYQLRDQLDTIRETQTSLQQAAQRKDEFLATLAHELRNPLAPISNALHLLNATLRDEKVAPTIAMMGRQVSHMVRLVDDLLEVSRITRGSVELRRESVDFATVIRGAIEAARPLVEANRHQLAVTLPAEPVRLDADAVRLTQIFTNLLNNAAKYMEPGGTIAVMVSIEPIANDGAQVVTVVKDQGVGIPGDQLEQIFGMFMQVDRADGRARGGLGIGLTLVKSLVELHGGTVTARSSGPNAGSEFTVRLPLPAGISREALYPLPGNAAPRRARLATHRILVVDDNHDAADSLAMLLRTSGATAQVVYDGRTALTSLATFEPDVVLLDIGMPGLDGYEVAQRMRLLRGPSELLIVAQTGWGQQLDRQRSVETGIDHHLIKPLDFEQLLQLIAAFHPQPARNTGPQVSGHRILVVDGNVDACESTATLLRRAGHTVSALHRGDIVADFVRAMRPDIIVLDIGLAGKNGYEVAREIREQQDSANILLIALATDDSDADRLRTRVAGFDHHFTKPVDFNALRKLLQVPPARC